MPPRLPISVRLLCDAHHFLLDGARGAGKQPGELRRSRNWIGGTRPDNAAFVPQPPELVPALLSEPLMYLSGYLKHHQAEYYRRLSAIRIERNIIEVASLVAADRKRLLQCTKVGPASYRVFEMLPMMLRFTIERVRQQLDTSFPTVTAAVKVLEDLDMVAKMTGQKKNRSYGYQAYVELSSR